MKNLREPMNALTHFVGLCLGIIGTIALFIRLWVTGNFNLLPVISVVAFGLGMICLYGASFTYHGFQGDKKEILRLKKWDHAMIFILIAGTYTPFCLLSLTGTMRIAMTTIVWGTAILGIVFKMVWINMPRWLGTAMYIFMGWYAIFVFGSLYQSMGLPGFMLLVGGGIMYTIGGVIYAMKKPNFSENFGFHELFHIFVILGSLCHYGCIFFFIL